MDNQKIEIEKAKSFDSGWRYGLLVGAIITNVAWVIAYITA